MVEVVATVVVAPEPLPPVETLDGFLLLEQPATKKAPTTSAAATKRAGRDRRDAMRIDVMALVISSSSADQCPSVGRFYGWADSRVCSGRYVGPKGDVNQAPAGRISQPATPSTTTAAISTTRVK